MMSERNPGSHVPRSIGRVARSAGIVAAAAAFAMLLAPAAPADTAILTRSGTLHEIYPATYGDVVPSAAETPEGRAPVLALRTTPAGGTPTVDIVEGTLDASYEGSQSIEYDETTKTLFVVYTQYQGLMSDVHFAVRRGGKWLEQNIAPNIGLYLSLNPRMLVTRQHYLEDDNTGGKVRKSRSILSLVWWEESGVSQARYAAVFIEDGSLDLEHPVVVNLNAFDGESGSAAKATSLPFSAYQFPALQRDAGSNGGLLVSFANLVTERQSVYRISFPDDLTLLTDLKQGKTYRRGRIPIGGRAGDTGLPNIDTQSEVGTVLSADGVPTFFWIDETGDARVMKYLRGDDPDAAIFSLPLRPDFSAERARGVLREMVDKQ